MSYQGINVRTAFEARPGYYFIDSDYSQIEARLSALMAGEKALIRSFSEGKDYYSMLFALMKTRGNADEAFKVVDTISKSERQIGKKIVLGQNYGQEKHGLAHTLRCPVDQAEELMEKFWDGQPATKRAKEEALQKAIRDGGVWTYFGRWRALPDLFSQDRKIKAKAMRSVWSTVCQGSAADIMKIAMVRVAKAIKGHDIHTILTVHDELVIEVSEKENIYEAEKLIKEAMEFPIKGLPPGSGANAFAVIPTAPEYGYDWGTLYSLEEFIEKYKDRINVSTAVVATAVPFICKNNEDTKIEMPVRDKGKVVMSLLPGQHPIDALLEATYLKMGKKCPVDVSASEVKVEKGSILEKPVLISPEMLKAEQKEMPEFLKTTEIEPGSPRIRPMPEQPIPVLPIPVVAVAEVPNFQAALVEKYDSDPVKQEVINVNDQLKQLASVIKKEESVEPSLPRKESDFVYPCIVVKVDVDLTQKLLVFLKTLFAKFPGESRVYMDYRGKLITSPSVLVDANESFMAYLRKALGNDVKVERFNKDGRVQGKVSF